MAAHWTSKVIKGRSGLAPAYFILAATEAELGNRDHASVAANKFLELKPNATMRSILSQFSATDTTFSKS